MNWDSKTYFDLVVARTSSVKASRNSSAALFYATGLAGEVEEFLAEYKKGHTFPQDEILAEAGDVLWNLIGFWACFGSPDIGPIEILKHEHPIRERIPSDLLNGACDICQVAHKLHRFHSNPVGQRKDKWADPDVANVVIDWFCQVLTAFFAEAGLELDEVLHHNREKLFKRCGIQ